MKGFECIDCGIDTKAVNEYYMVQDELWEAHGPVRGMLCIGCLEARIGRQLTPADFSDCLLNTRPFKKSLRLAQRLGFDNAPTS